MQKEDVVASSRHNPEIREADFSDALGDSPESLARVEFEIRSLVAGDFNAICRIDKRLTGLDRSDYLAQKMDEVINQSGIRVSLVAEQDGLVTGFIMARMDHGEYGQTASFAVIDTIGINPGFPGAGSALLNQLFANLGSLRLDALRTIVKWDDTAMNHFLSKAGFEPAQQLALRCAL
ncbi:MAG: GNAT family N-acetyltransferase [Gammaproteobacteria bacterium]|nr:GNAT family N-acetyltransferase [Gammaproteobacteria bacterium]